MIVSLVGRVRKQKIRLAGAKESGTKASCRIQCRPLLYNRSGVSIGQQRIHLLVCKARGLLSLTLFTSPLHLFLQYALLLSLIPFHVSLCRFGNVCLSRSLSGISPRATLLISAADIAIFTAPAGEIVVDSGKPAIMHYHRRHLVVGPRLGYANKMTKFWEPSDVRRCQIFSRIIAMTGYHRPRTSLWPRDQATRSR